MIRVSEAPARRRDMAAPTVAGDRGLAWPQVHLADLIAPVSVEDFFGRYWERRHLHLPGGSEAATHGLFNLQELDHLLSRLPRPATVRVAREGDEDGSSRLAHADASGLPSLYQQFSGGHTIIVDRMQVLWEPVAELCRNLMVDVGMQVQANLYVTPPHAAGFPCHWDGHDTLILQLEGQKVWSIYRRHDGIPHPSSDGDRHEAETSPDHEVTLQPGDVLYIPRGMPHQASTRGETSVHLTVGLMAATWKDLLVASIESLVTSDPELHRSLPQGWLGHEPDQGRYRKRCRELAQRLSADGVIEAGLRLLAARHSESAPCLPDGHFQQLGELHRIDRETTVATRSGRLLRASRHGRQARLSFPGSFVSGPAKLFWAFDFIAGSSEFVVGDIPGWYSDAERIMIARVLVSAGCLRVVAPAQPTVRLDPGGVTA